MSRSARDFRQGDKVALYRLNQTSNRPCVSLTGTRDRREPGEQRTGLNARNLNSLELVTRFRRPGAALSLSFSLFSHRARFTPRPSGTRTEPRKNAQQPQRPEKTRNKKDTRPTFSLRVAQSLLEKSHHRPSGFSAPFAIRQRKRPHRQNFLRPNVY